MKPRRSLQEADARRRVLREMVEEWGLAFGVLGGMVLFATLCIVGLPLALLVAAGLTATVFALHGYLLSVFGWAGGVLVLLAWIGVFVVVCYRNRLRRAGILPTRCPVCQTKPCRSRCEEIYGAEYVASHRALT